MTRIAAVRALVPEHRYPQERITGALIDGWGLTGTKQALLRRLHTAVGVRRRGLALPIERYAGLDGFGGANDAYVAESVTLGARAVEGALDDAGLDAKDVDLILTVSTTGVAAPSIDTRIAAELGLRADVRRVPVFGLGCVGGAAGLARVHDHLTGWPGHVAVLLSVELCSLTLQRHDRTLANLVASALFGDGAAAVVVCGAAHDLPAAPTVLASRSRLYPDSEHLMGWRVSGDGFGVMLDPGIPEMVRAHLADDVRGFLAAHGLTPRDITPWICHPGGPKIIDAVVETLGLSPSALALTRTSLREKGNLSSASVLHVLSDTLAASPPPAGGHALLMALGPGFCAELVLLAW
ncbi:type III polyketide synthase [Actinocorallia sp. API 0066]|uniref:type III polyketide synthase n=1 Tax=Actinocorallia sp. API 0066 TaxID=2896846 RepID=UPI001E366ED3|nr:3-oxoacyl-[acyl-carrier-protein] synthase III C-terminal domain-containing protein [Actinocorallia sp. API 0066]MCD0452157.1 type III polyketide synthase [Actinocorallia sp. API 0066]